jgi:hypothetical protein
MLPQSCHLAHGTSMESRHVSEGLLKWCARQHAPEATGGASRRLYFVLGKPANVCLLFSAQRIGFQPKFIQPELHPPLAFLAGNVHNVGLRQQIRGNPAEETRRVPGAYA